MEKENNEQYQILIAFDKKIAKYGKPIKDLKTAQNRLNKLMSQLKPMKEFKISTTIIKGKFL